jgi:uncharacterized protein (PEP-CTERM system associated)
MICAGNFLNRQAGLMVMIVFMNTAYAGGWDITPRISLAEIFSDNINLDDDDKEYDLVTEITPGIRISREGGRLSADIDYEMQNLIFLNETDASGSNHRLNGNSTAELARDLVFVDATARAGQSLVDANSTRSNSNINNAGNTTDFYAYSLSPYLRNDFAGWAEGLFRYTYGEVIYDDDDSDDQTQNSFDARMNSGRKFGPMSWTATANHTTLDYDSSSGESRDDEEYRNAELNARYRISSLFSLIGTAGHADNDYNTTDEIENGSYWAIGGFIQPSRYYSFEAQKGNNLKTATANAYPTRRTALTVTYRDREVGLNPGEVWEGSFNHYTRRTTWQARYFEDTTTQQQQLLTGSGPSFGGIDPETGEPNPDPQPGDLPVDEPLDPFFSLTNEVYERKRGEGTFGMKGGKTGLRITIFEERREYQVSGDEERVRGISGSIDRRLAPRTNGILSGYYERNLDDSADSDLEDVYAYLRTEVTRRISRKATGSIAYQLQLQDSNDDSRDYTENSLVARLTVVF